MTEPGYIAPIRGHKCRECVYYPASMPSFCYCQMRGKQVVAGQTACVYGRKRTCSA